MSDELRRCASGGFVVDCLKWLPAEPFDHDWGASVAIGCNHIHCSRCDQRVRAESTHNSIRRYTCSCSSHEESGTQALRIDGGYPGLSALSDPVQAPWACAGHPALTVPSVLDGVSISPERLRDAARVGFASPPFVPPGASGGIWVERLYWILPTSLRPALVDAASELVLDDDPRVASGAINFHSEQRDPVGGQRLVAIAREHGARLAKIPYPHNPHLSLEDLVLFALRTRAFARDDAGRPVDPEAHELMRRVALAGRNPRVVDDLVYTFARVEPDWLAGNAAEIVKHTPSLADTMVFLFRAHPEDRRVAVYRSVAALGPAIRADVCKEIEERFHGEERARMLAALDP